MERPITAVYGAASLVFAAILGFGWYSGADINEQMAYPLMILFLVNGAGASFALSQLPIIKRRKPAPSSEGG